MKKINLWILALLIFLSSKNNFHAQNIVINEILTSNTTSITDENGSHEDWIELYNNSSSSISLSGYGISDDPLLPFKWTFPNVSLGSGNYLIVWASDKNRTASQGPLHTNFKISASGENILLTNPSGVIVDQVPPINLSADVSYGRKPNGTGSFVLLQTPTPNGTNSSTETSGALNPPTFSTNSGFYPTDFNLTLTSDEPGITILYTLDGSEPDENNLGSGTTYDYKNKYTELPGQPTGPLLKNSYRTLQYSSPINITDRSSQPNKVSVMSSTFSFDPNYYFPDNPVFKGTVVRAKVVKAGSLPSEIITKTYFVTPEGKNKFTLPVVSISINEDRFFDYTKGIYVAGKDFDDWRAGDANGSARQSDRGNYYFLDIESERVGNISYFVNGDEKISQQVGLRIRGGSSRRFENKTLSVFARKDYGDGDLDCKFFNDLPYTSYERLTLSNSGQDFHDTLFRDALIHELCKSLYPEKEAYQPAIAFLNGEYWGILNLRERYDNNYFKRVYNADAVDFLEYDGAPEEGDNVHYKAMMSYLGSNSLASTTNFDYIKTQLDPDSFSDYYITEIFFQNSDWPNNNIHYWRNKISAYNPTAPYGLDGRWRWVFHDLDATFSSDLHDFNSNTLAIATSVDESGVNPAWSTLILRRLLENDTYKNYFINRFADLLNTSFLSTRIISKMDEMTAVLTPEMPGQISRWSFPSSMDKWHQDLQEEKDFANARPALQRDHIRAKFGISKNLNAILDVSDQAHGYIKISTIDIKNGTPGITGNPYPWTGIYFSNIPIKLKAIAKTGFKFDHWTEASSSTQEEITITPTDNFKITAVFVPTNEEASVPIYFWYMGALIPNGDQLTHLNSTYQLNAKADILYQSCIAGYPFPTGDPNNGKASMERRNQPTSLNYRAEANGNAAYSVADMKGLQIKEPLQKDGLENTLIFNISTLGYKKIKFSYAVMNEGTNATALSVDYSINSGTPDWITTGLAATSLPLSAAYQLLESDFSSITSVDNNPNFKIRLRFTGSNMTVDSGLGKRVSFNNIAVDGVKTALSYPTPNVFTVGTAITNLTPSVAQAVNNYSVSPTLPAGLAFSTSTGVISGTPTAASSKKTYTVTANITGGTLTANLDITVNAPEQISLSYNTPNVFTRNTAITNLSPTVSGGTVTNYSIAPALPTGLSINNSTGVISGTPTVISAKATYTVTATSSGGNATFALEITVNDSAPTNLSYNTPNVFTRNTAITNLSPTVSGGTVTNYSIAPALPTGLSISNSTGVISGTPTVLSAKATYTVTATTSGGNATFDLEITVNDSAPTNLSYNTPNVFTRNTAITNLSPTVTGTVTNYSIAPDLPAGLSINNNTGVISGTPTVVSAKATYTVTAATSGGNATFDLEITVNDSAPTNLSYNTPNVFTRNTAITNLSPTVTGTVTNHSIAPDLPAGLSINNSTGVISGTPTVLSAKATYTVTATTSGGNATFDLEITVNDSAPTNLSYNTPNVFTKNIAISSLNPTVGGGTVTNYSIAPDLPTGLSINNITGAISGTPTVLSAKATYTVTATSSEGSTTFALEITINDSAPTNLSYNTPNVFTKNIAISSLNPTVGGGTVTNYSIAPDLPTGLSINNVTGVISGTPTVLSAKDTYTVTATNSGGSAYFELEITVNDATLTYPTPNVFTKNTQIISLSPTHSGGSIISYSVSPNLPAGLELNASTGIISGTPTVISKSTHTVTANYTGGKLTFELEITVNDVAPYNLSYPSPNLFTKNITIPNLNPNVSGGNVISYGITPSLPTGLNLQSTTGEISGTPTVISPETVYKITATNSGGSCYFNLTIIVESTLSIDDIGFKKFKLYPNPFTDLINVAGISTNFSYRLFNVDRKLIKSESDTTSPIDFTGLSIGTYILEISADKVKEIGKIIKNK